MLINYIRRWSCLLLGISLAYAAPAGIRGFTPENAAAQSALEQRFDGALNAAELREWMRQMSSAPNQVGSAHDKENAEFELRKFREWGWDAALETFSVLYPTPREISLEMLEPVRYVANLREPKIEGDATSAQVADELPAYNAYGADGDVTAPLVYVNRGMPEDYLELARLRIEVAGKIVIVRYGGGWRGLKPKLAYEHGAIGCLIYSDPRDDGYGAGDVYPKGGYRPADAVQRGSVADMPVYAGDPLTPGVGATPTAKRLAIKDARTLMKIPVVPISYATALPLLAALNGPVAPESWRGGLPLTYHVGPGAARVHLKIVSDWTQKTIYDVIAKIPGDVEPDRWVIRGNHHDAWVFGATDPLSGQVALMAEAQAIGRLRQSGWKPHRTIIYASWDGEEPGLIGSTEWVEAHAAELRDKAVMYINSDSNARGTLHAGGSQGLRSFVSEAAAAVPDPETTANVLARHLALAQVEALAPGAKASAVKGELAFGALGGGSDFSPFLQYLGVSTIDLGFGGEDEYGVYHSAYDSFDHFRRFVDPSFDYGVALAKLAGRAVLRTAQGDLLPLRAQDFAAAAGRYADEVTALVDAMRKSATEQGEVLDSGAFALADDPAKPRAPPQRKAPVPYLELSALNNALLRLKSGAQAFDIEYDRSLVAGDAASMRRRARINETIARLELALLDPRGLPGRDWYHHMMYAPGLKTGYDAKTLPGIREAIEDSRWQEANRYSAIVAAALNAYSADLEQAVKAR